MQGETSSSGLGMIPPSFKFAPKMRHQLPSFRTEARTGRIAITYPSSVRKPKSVTISPSKLPCYRWLLRHFWGMAACSSLSIHNQNCSYSNGCLSAKDLILKSQPFYKVNPIRHAWIQGKNLYLDWNDIVSFRIASKILTTSFQFL